MEKQEAEPVKTSKEENGGENFTKTHCSKDNNDEDD
jgi:hypothetical protein